MDKTGTCVVDFDGTLLKADSMLFIFLRERLFLYPPLLWRGLCLAFAKTFLPLEKQAYVRKKFKFVLLQLIYRRGFERVLERYGDELKRYLNNDLVEFVGNKYENIYVISSSWEPLVRKILKKTGGEEFNVRGTEYADDFGEFKPCWHSEKKNALARLNIKHFDLFTDSYEDFPLMQSAQSTFLVNKNGTWKKSN